MVQPAKRKAYMDGAPTQVGLRCQHKTLAPRVGGEGHHATLILPQAACLSAYKLFAAS